MANKKLTFLRIFLRELASLVSAGIPVHRSLEILALHQTDPWARGLVGRLVSRVYAGEPVSTAMAAEANTFPKFVTGLVHVGEETGALATNLGKSAEFVEQMDRLRMKIFSVITYPLFLLGVTLAGIVLLVEIFVPAFSPVFLEMHATLPLPTRVVISMFKMISAPLFWESMLVILAIFSFMHFLNRRHDQRRLGWDRFVLTLPFLGGLMKRWMVAQIVRTLAMTQSVGISLPRGLAMLEDTSKNEVFRVFIQDCRLVLARGENLSAYFLARKNFVPSFVSHLVAVAETTGSLESLMLKCGRILEEEIDYLLQRFFAFLEPGILGFMGVAVSFILFSVLLPLYGMMGLIQ